VFAERDTHDRRRRLLGLAGALCLAVWLAFPAAAQQGGPPVAQEPAPLAAQEASPAAEPEPSPPSGEQVPQPPGIARFEARIEEMELFENARHLYTSFALEGALVPRVRDQIRSGLEVSFSYRVELVKKHTWWVDKMLAKRKVMTRVAHDPETGRYHLTRFVDDVVDDSAVTEDEEVMRRWMTRVERLPLLPAAEFPAEGKMVLRVRAKVHDDFVLLFIPWDYEAPWGRLIVRPGQIPPEEDEPPADPGS
jgi:hypothetical protein